MTHSNRGRGNTHMQHLCAHKQTTSSRHVMSRRKRQCHVTYVAFIMWHVTYVAFLCGLWAQRCFTCDSWQMTHAWLCRLWAQRCVTCHVWMRSISQIRIRTPHICLIDYVPRHIFRIRKPFVSTEGFHMWRVRNAIRNIHVINVWQTPHPWHCDLWVQRCVTCHVRTQHFTHSHSNATHTNESRHTTWPKMTSSFVSTEALPMCVASSPAQYS